MIYEKWITNNCNCSDERVVRLSRSAGISTIISKIFINRGIDEPEYIKNFLNPDMKNLYDPFSLKDMDKTVYRIIQAISSKEKITIFGDYDVDGVTSTSMLYSFLISKGADVNYFIPSRENEGYGLTLNSIERVLEINPSLIITVDCGITSIDEVNYLSQKNIDVLITDHHRCKEILPNAYAVVNPCREDCKYPFKSLAGAGVVLKLISALCIKMGVEDEYLDFIDLAALGTIADVVPLVDENRIITCLGLSRMQDSNNIGIKALLNVSNHKDSIANSWTVSFALAPRINAAGRLGDASLAVKLFTTDDTTNAKEIAEFLDQNNKLRQSIELEIFNEINEMVENEADGSKIIIVAKEGWNAGVIGIAASKITERYHRPTAVIAIEDNVGKASCRSIEDFNIHEALKSCEDFFDKFGGHKQAAGFTIRMDKFELFKQKLTQLVQNSLTDDQLLSKIRVDAMLTLEDISFETINQLNMLAPFGMDNFCPVFEFDHLEIVNIRTLSDGKHLKLKLKCNQLVLDAIGFNMGKFDKTFTKGDFVDVLCNMEINSWNGNQSIQLVLKDMRPSHNNYSEKDINLENKTDSDLISNDLEIEKLIDYIRKAEISSQGNIKLTKSISSVAYQLLNSLKTKKFFLSRQELEEIYRFVKRKKDLTIDRIPKEKLKVRLAVEVFKELGLITEEEGILKVCNVNNKASLDDSNLYRKLRFLEVT